jgi:hypothetical protein
MESKLTLKLDRRAIKRAKRYALSNNDSLSRLVEKYFNSLTKSEINAEEKLPPIVRSLTGILKSKEKINIKKEYADYLERKFG